MVPWSQIAQSGSSFTSNLASGLGASGASNAMEEMLRKNKKAARNYLAYSVGLNYPGMSVGNQALQDLGGAMGYSVPGIDSQQGMSTAFNNFSPKDVKGMIKQGLSVDQISQMGNVQLNAKTIKRLTRAGLSMDQIQQLSSSGNATTPTQPASGSTGNTAPANNFQRFIDSPDYQFNVNQAMQAIDRGAAARGGALSGNALAATAQRANDLASQQYENWFRRRLALVNNGNYNTGNAQNAGSNTLQTITQANNGIGDARASGLLGTWGAAAQHFTDLGNIWGGGGMGGMMGGMGGGGANGTTSLGGSAQGIPANSFLQAFGRAY